MGTVSTAVTEEALSECLKRSSYQYSDSASKDDIKCSICQVLFSLLILLKVKSLSVLE